MANERNTATASGIATTAPDGVQHGSESAGHAPTREVMHAVVQDAYGGADVLRLAEIDRPDIASNEVLVKVRAAGMDRGTWHSMSGKPYLMRVMGFGFRRPKNRVAGLDV